MKVILYVYPGLTLLDAIGPYEVLRNLPHTEVVLVAQRRGKIPADSRMAHLHVQHQIDEVDRADVLLVPGSTVAFLQQGQNQRVIDWLRRLDQTTQYTASVCTGSIILAAAGLLKGRPATSHWKALPLLADYGAKPTQERVVVSDKYLTGAGVSAGLDLALTLAQNLKGTAAAQVAQLLIEYDPEPPFTTGNLRQAPKSIVRRAERRLQVDALQELKARDILRQANKLLRLAFSR